MSEGIKRSNAPLQFGLMLAIVIATMLAGYLMTPDSDEERQALVDTLGTSNRGVLLSPTLAIEALELRGQDGALWTVPEGKLRWRILVPAVAPCDDACRQMLYITRQIHVRLNKQSHRVERGFVSLDGPVEPVMAEFLSNEHPHILTLHTDRDSFAAWQAGSQLDWQADRQVAILVDPVGRAMMFYTSEHPGTDILLDLGHLLKHSPE